jgi:ABC-2 type transport system ATP-binding protein
MDEPTVGLDARSRDAVWEYLTRLRAERDLTLIITTHYVEEVENCDRVCIIDQGKVVALDTPNALKAQHGQAYIRLRPADAAAAEAITARYPDLVTAVPEGLLVRIPEQQFTRAFLGEFGDRLDDLSFDRSSLASVFLTITGRQLSRPEPVAGKREGRL